MNNNTKKDYTDQVFAQTAEYPTADAAQTLANSVSEAGDIFANRYSIQKVLGKGGFATVFLAEDTNLKRQVALKILRPDRLEDPQQRTEFVARFQLEATIIARMDHENIIPVYDCNVLTEEDGKLKPYIAMKHLDGFDLEEILQDHGALTPERTLDLTKQALLGLQYVHKMGVVHKDLKPSNFFVTQRNGKDHLYLMDFGIAHDHNDAAGRMTQTGHITGTPQYIAPEYALQGDVTPAIDVYQMGLILCEMYTGQPIFGNDLTYAAIIAKHIKGEVEPPDELKGSPLGKVIERALAPDAADRYADAGEMLDAIDWIDPRALDNYSGQHKAATPSDNSPTVIEPMVPDQALRTQRPQHTTAPVSAMPNNAPESSNGRLIGIAVILLCTIGILAAVVIKMMEKPKQQDVIPDTKTTQNNTPKTAEKAIAVPSKTIKPRAPWKIMVLSEPSKAKVFYNGKLQGFTPTDFKINSTKGQVVSVRLVMDGYEDHTFSAPLTDEQTLTFSKKLVESIKPKKFVKKVAAKVHRTAKKSNTTQAEVPKKEQPKKEVPKKEIPKKEVPKKEVKVVLPGAN